MDEKKRQNDLYRSNARISHLKIENSKKKASAGRRCKRREIFPRAGPPAKCLPTTIISSCLAGTLASTRNTIMICIISTFLRKFGKSPCLFCWWKQRRKIVTKNNPEARSDFVLAVYGDKCLIFGGSTNLRRLNDFHELNLSNKFFFLLSQIRNQRLKEDQLWDLSKRSVWTHWHNLFRQFVYLWRLGWFKYFEWSLIAQPGKLQMKLN